MVVERGRRDARVGGARTDRRSSQCCSIARLPWRIAGGLLRPASKCARRGGHSGHRGRAVEGREVDVCMDG